ncbi:hypothetical protein TF_19 [Pseudomonas phage vB_PaeP_TF17]|nr:hypothetical protein TF_19 [Pseudomonas phage vB_PaeP_TF17]
MLNFSASMRLYLNISRKLILHPISVLGLFLVLSSLSGCAEQKPIPRISPALLVPINKPPEPVTFQDYVIYHKAASKLLDMCNGRLESIGVENGNLSSK